MYQYTLGLDPLSQKTRKEVFLDKMNQEQAVALAAAAAAGTRSMPGVTRATRAWICARKVQGCKAQWHMACARASSKHLILSFATCWTKPKAEHLKVSVRAKVGHPVRVIKQQFGDAKVR